MPRAEVRFHAHGVEVVFVRRKDSLGAIFLLLLAIDVVFSGMGAMAYASLLDFTKSPIDTGNLPWLLVVLNLVKTLSWGAVYWRIAFRLMPGIEPSEATGRTLDRMPLVVASVFALTWTLLYLLLTFYLLERTPGRQPEVVSAMVPFSIAVFMAAWSLIYSMTDWLFEPVGQRVYARLGFGNPSSGRLLLRWKIGLLGLALALAPTAWMWALWQMSGSGLSFGNDAIPISDMAFFILPALVWAPLVAYYLSASIAGPIANIHRVVDELGEKKARADRVQVSRRDELGMLGFHVNKMADQLAEAIDALIMTVHRVESALNTRDDFISVASHELNTPLTALLLQLQHVERLSGAAGKEATPIKIETAIRQVKRLGELVDSLLDVSRISSGKLSLLPEPFDLGQALSDIVDRFRLEASRSGSEMNFRPAGSVTVRLDRVRFEQVMNNLVSNALKYGAGRPIDVAYEKTAEVVRVHVSDHGNGIAEYEQEKLFLKYERLPNKQAVKGLGLGLYITKEIVEAHRGRIAVKSRDGGPTTFTVEFPYNGEAAEQPLRGGNEEAGRTL